MSDLMYQCSVSVFIHNLKNLSAILKAAAKDAKARGISPEVILNARLAPDMLPLTSQVQIAADHAKGASARLAAVAVPVFADTEKTFAQLEDRIKRTIAFLRSLKPAQFEGSDKRDILLKLPVGELSFTGADYLNGWALPNFYFHHSTAYSVLRHNGVSLGKRDFLGQVPGMAASGKLAKMLGVKAKKARVRTSAAAKKT